MDVCLPFSRVCAWAWGSHITGSVSNAAAAPFDIPTTAAPGCSHRLHTFNHTVYYLSQWVRNRGFDLRFPDDSRCPASFPELVGHFCIFFGEGCLNSFAHSQIGLFTFLLLRWKVSCASTRCLFGHDCKHVPHAASLWNEAFCKPLNRTSADPRLSLEGNEEEPRLRSELCVPSCVVPWSATQGSGRWLKSRVRPWAGPAREGTSQTWCPHADPARGPLLTAPSARSQQRLLLRGVFVLLLHRARPVREAGPDRGLAGRLPARPGPGQKEDLAEPLATLVPQAQEGRVRWGRAGPGTLESCLPGVSEGLAPA